MGKTNQKWFQNQLQSQGITQRKLAAVLHLDPSGVSQLLKGKRRMRAEEAAEIARLLSVPLEDVLRNAGIDLETAETTGSLAIGQWIDGHLNVHNEPPKGPKKAPAPMAGSRDLRVARIIAHGSVNAALDGALVYFKANRSVDPDAIGRMAVVQIQGEVGFKLRVVSKGYSPGTFNLSYPNGAVVESDVVLAAATPVVWLKL